MSEFLWFKEKIVVNHDFAEKSSAEIVIDDDFGVAHGIQLLRLKDKPEVQLELNNFPSI